MRLTEEPTMCWSDSQMTSSARCFRRLSHVSVERLVSVFLCVPEAAALPCSALFTHQGPTVHSCGNAEPGMRSQPLWWWVHYPQSCLKCTLDLHLFMCFPARSLRSPVCVLVVWRSLWEAVWTAWPWRSVSGRQRVHTWLLLSTGEF